MRNLVACLVVVGVLTTACGASEPRPSASASSKEIGIGLLYPTVGAQQAGGNEEERGARLAIEWANDHGGLGGQRFVAEPATVERPESVPVAMDRLAQRGVTIVLGSHGSAVSAAAAQAATRLDMTLWETGAVGEIPNTVAGGRNFFRLAPMGANLGRAGIAFIAEQLAAKLAANFPANAAVTFPANSSSKFPAGPLRYAVAYIDDPYGRAVGRGAEAAIRERGYDLGGTFSYEPQTRDFAPLVARIAETRPDVLFVSAYLDDGVALRRAVVAAHVPLLASIGTSSSYCHPAFGSALGNDAVGLFASDKPDAANLRTDALAPEGRNALAWAKQRYEGRYREAMSAPALSGFSNAFAVLVHVLPAAKRLDAAGLADAAQSVKLPEGTLPNGGGLDLGPVGAPDAGENRAASGVIWEWVARYTRAVVWPPAYATHAIVALPLSR